MGVVPGDRISDADLEAWARVQEAEPSLASPFFRPEFAQIVAGERDDAWVGIARQDESEPAFFPFQRTRLGRGRPIGGRLSDYQGLVARAGVELDARSLLRQCDLRGWDFGAVVASQPTFRPFHTRARTSPLLDLTRGFQSFVEERATAGSDQIEDVHRQRDRFAAEVGDVRFEAHVDDPAALELLIRWKSAQYARTETVDIFSYPWVRNVVAGVHSAQHENFGGLLSVLYAADEPVAAHLGPRSSSVWHYWLPAYDRRVAKHSPGLILLLEMAAAASDLGLGIIDLGKGDALYKTRLANGSVPLAEGSVDASFPAAVTASALRAGSRLIRRTPLAGRADLIATRRSFA